MKTILAAIDGSEHSRLAVDLATDLAGKYGAELLLLHVIDSRAPNDAEKRLAETEFSEQFEQLAIKTDLMDLRSMGTHGVEPVFAHYAETSRTIRTAVGEGLLQGASRKAAEAGVEKVVNLMENGDPSTVILEVAKKRNADTIVMGSRGQGDLKSLFLGSASHKVANLADATVITVK